MKKRTIGVFLLTMLAMVAAAAALDASTPYSQTLKWIVPSDTTFTVTRPGGETTVDFNPASDTETEVEPDGQAAATGEPSFSVVNAGNINLNFTIDLTTSKPAWAVLKVNNGSTGDYASARTFDTDEVIIQGFAAPDANVSTYLWTDITSADVGETTRTLEIHSAASS